MGCRFASATWLRCKPVRRSEGALDHNGREAVGGIVVMRYRENPREVIRRVVAKIDALQAELGGIRIRPVYDRTQLIDETVSTLTEALGQETIITVAVTVLFLLHVRASLVIAFTLPMAVLMAFAAMNVFQVDANIMSLAGIAIAIGTMVDLGIVILENIYGGLAEWESAGSPGGPRRRLAVIRDSAAEVVPAVITAVSTTVVSFLPVFFLTGRDFKLFAPLAWTKTFSLVASLVVAVAVVPMLCRVLLRSARRPWWAGLLSGLGLAGLAGGLVGFVWRERLAHWTWLDPSWATTGAALVGLASGWWLARERILPIEENIASRCLRWIYGARLRTALRYKALMLSFPLALIVLGLGAWIGLPTVLRPVEHLAEKLGRG